MSRISSPNGADLLSVSLGSALDDDEQSKQANAGSSTPLSDDEQRQRYYAAAVGRSASRYYLKSFARFDRHPWRLSWNGWSFLISFLWLLYRRLWWVAGFHLLLPIVLFLIIDLIALGDRQLQLGILIGYLAYTFVLLPLMANGLYYRSVRAKIRAAESRYSDPAQIEAALKQHGGGNGWAVVICLLAVAGLMAGGAYRFGLPFYHDYVVTTKLDIGYRSALQYQQEMVDYIDEHQGQLPKNMAELGEERDNFYDHIRRISVTSNGAIQVDFKAPPELAGRNLQLIPQVTPVAEDAPDDAKPKVSWKCVVKGVSSKFLPKECHNG